MQRVKIQTRFLGWMFAFAITSAMVIACNNEGEKSEAAADTPAAEAPAAPDSTGTDTLPTIDTSASTRPDGSTTGGAK